MNNPNQIEYQPGVDNDSATIDLLVAIARSPQRADYLNRLKSSDAELVIKLLSTEIIERSLIYYSHADNQSGVCDTLVCSRTDRGWRITLVRELSRTVTMVVDGALF